MSRKLFLTVTSVQRGMRLDSLVAQLPEVGSRSRAAALIEQGSVTVDGRSRPKSYRVDQGEQVEVSLLEPCPVVLEVEEMSVPVVYEDEWLFIVDKPAGVVVHPAKGHESGTLVHALLQKGLAGGDELRPGIVHRLDRDTSGLLIVARDREAHRRLSEMIRRREVERHYLALVHGNLTEATGTIDAPIGRDQARRKTMSVEGHASRQAVTHFTVLERLGEFTLLDVRLETGRTHQIRVHFLAIGHPVAGDPVYARRDPLALGRQFLHSHRLEFRHPMTGEMVLAISPLPGDLEAALSGARAHAH